MENPQKPWKVEYAKSSRSSCRTCKTPIEKEVLRVGKMVQSKQFDGLMPMWSHADCLLKKANQIKSIGDIEGIEALRWNDQQKITKYIESCGQTDETPAKAPGKSSGKAAATTEHGVEVSKTSRASCKKCSEKIMKGEVRLSSKPEGQGPRGLVWHHAQCFMDLFPSVQVEKVSGWTSLTTSDQESVLSLIKGKAPLSGVEEPSQKSNTKVAGKRKTDATNGQGIKIAKVEPDHAVSKCVSKKDTELERKLEAQTKELWGLKDQLKKHVSTAELRLMLEANDQDSTGSELVLRDNCADGMLFGALEKCPMCSGHLRCSGGKYRCHGWLSEWSKCTYSTAQPERVKGNWEIPEGSENAYLLKWFKGQKATKPARVVPLSCDMTSGSPVANGRTQSVKEEKLGDLKVAFTKLAKDSVKEFKSQIEGAGGQVHAKIKKETNCLIVGEVDEPDAEMRKARRMKIPIVREEYIKDCVAKQKKLPFDRYKVESVGESASMATVKVKGRSAVHESSGLQDSGHILEVGNNIYNTTLNMSDLSTGVNSYYILQIIEEDKGSDCYVFRKWGRVGNDSIGSFKLEEMTKSDAIEEFERLFFEKTGNYWEDWVNRTSIQKHRGKYFPLDIDYGASKQLSTRKINNDDTKLAPALAELIKMLFNVEAYRAAMMEFEINLSEMPLGKLSRSNIQQGYEALTQLQNLFSDQTLDASIRENFIVDASNRFFTMIPSVHPHVIKDEDDFKSKVKMLDALQEIEIASRLVGFDADSDDTLDEKYKKLHCDINPLPHDSEEYQLIEKYLRRTHAPTHTEWGLELEEVFALEREGESDKFAPQREKLGNRMLLWHGSRLTNFVGILSQGLRIAPPEAPATGYMFGKGVYFADLVSKSAQYCFTDKKSPVGLMVLSEVALGEMYELKKSKYMDKPPRGKHSTKGLGKKVPLESEYVKWKDDVVVPCGKPVDSKVRSSELMYNEYIVYDTAQVKMQFLLKVRFHHKR